MATSFPTGLDTYSDVVTGGTILAATTNNVQDSIEALEVKMGINSSAVTASLDYLVKNSSSTDPGHLHTTSGISGQIAVAQGGTGSSTASAARTALGVAIGSDVQAYDADLTELAGLSDSDGNFIVGSASGWVAESGATARTSIGLGSVENTALSTWAGTTNVTTLGTIATGVWNGTAVADTYVANDLTIAGGTVNSSVIGGSTAAAGTFTQLDIEAEGDLRLQDATGGEYVGWDAPATVSSSYMMTLPAAIGAVGEVLKINNTDGTLEWGEAGGGTAFTEPVTITVNDSDPALEIAQSGAGNALTIKDGSNLAMQIKDGGDMTIGQDAGGATTQKIFFATHAMSAFYPNIYATGQLMYFNGNGIAYDFMTSGGSLFKIGDSLVTVGRSGATSTLEMWGDDVRTRSITGTNGRIRIKFGGWTLSNEVVSGLATGADDVGGLFTADRGTTGDNSQGAFRAERPDGSNYLWLWPDNSDNWRVLNSEPSAYTDGAALLVGNKTATITVNSSDPALKIEQSGAGEGLWVTDATAASYTKITDKEIAIAVADGVNPKEATIGMKLSGGTGYLSMSPTIFTDTTKALVIGNLLGNQLEIRNKTTWYTDSASDGTITWTRNNDHPLGFIIGTDALSQIGHIDLKAGATGTASAVAYLAMESSDSTMYYLFFDNDGDLRMDSSKPVANGQGTVVGTQS